MNPLTTLTCVAFPMVVVTFRALGQAVNMLAVLPTLNMILLPLPWSPDTIRTGIKRL